jgi:hypothetical protein
MAGLINILSSSVSPEGSNFYCYHLPKGMLHIKVSEIWQNNSQSFRLEHNTQLIPDPDNRYYLRYNTSSLSEDDVVVEFTPLGFLKSVTTVSEDKTAEVAEKIGELITDVAEAATVPGAVGRDLGMRRPDSVRVVYDVVFDPFDTTEVGRVSKELQSYHPELKFGIKRIRKSKDPETPIDPGSVANAGIFFKPPEPCEITFSLGENSMERYLVNLPHPERIHYIEVPRARFVKTSFDIQFHETDAYPVKIHINKPSQALALIEVPIKFLAAIISIPAKLFQFRVNLSNEKVKALQSESQLSQATIKADADRTAREKQAELETRKAMLEANKKIAELEKEISAFNKA